MVSVKENPVIDKVIQEGQSDNKQEKNAYITENNINNITSYKTYFYVTEKW